VRRRPRMTPDEARSFAGVSTASCMAVAAALAAREHPCTCEPYEDVFTLPRWNAQGYTIRKGSKSIRIACWIPTEASARELDTAEEAGEDAPAPRLRPWTAHLFCRCQVTEKAKAKVAA